jgi:hypothetical protein
MSLINTNNDDIITPEVLARKLLFDDDIKNYSGILLPFIVSDEGDMSNIYDKCAGQFEILITLYMEMVYGLLMINHINKYINDDGEIDNTIDLEATFNPDLTEYDISELTDIFSEKLKKVRIILLVQEIYEDEIYSDYYCRIILKETKKWDNVF